MMVKISMAISTVPRVFWLIKDPHYWSGFRFIMAQYHGDNVHNRLDCPKVVLAAQIVIIVMALESKELDIILTMFMAVRSVQGVTLAP